jgi:hypothetical protein
MGSGKQNSRVRPPITTVFVKTCQNVGSVKNIRT